MLGMHGRTMATDELFGRAKQTLERIRNAALATAATDGRPWNSPLYVALDEHLTFYWASRRDAVHSRNIAANPEVLLVVFDSVTDDHTGHAVYVRGKAVEINDEATLTHALECMARRKQEPSKAAADFLPPHERRMYKVEPETIWTNVVEIRDGHYVDGRIELERARLAEVTDFPQSSHAIQEPGTAS